MTTHEKRAEELFLAGYNCAQAVFGAFCDVTGMDEQTAMRLSSSMGGGMGRLREVCGAVSGIFLAAGLLYGYDSPTASEEKRAHYARIRALAERFQALHGSIVCRELLASVQTTPGGDPEPRTPAFYHARPCYQYVRDAARLLDEYILTYPPEKPLHNG